MNEHVRMRFGKAVQFLLPLLCWGQIVNFFFFHIFRRKGFLVLCKALLFSYCKFLVNMETNVGLFDKQLKSCTQFFNITGRLNGG